MKSLIRSFVFNIASIYLTTLIIPGFAVAGGAKFIIIAGVAFTLLNFFLKPLIKVLFFPINILTLGLFSWVINVAIIYILLYFVREIQITPWNFVGFSFRGFMIPAIYFTKFLTVVLISFVLSLIFSFLNWLAK